MRPRGPFEGWAGGHHTPPHLLLDDTWYMVSARACDGLKWFEDQSLAVALCEVIEEQYALFDWQVELYVVMPDHYHVVTRSARGVDLPEIVRRLHSKASVLMRRRLADAGAIGAITAAPRKCFYNYWDECLNTEEALLKAMEYVRTNPSRAGLVADADEYRFRGPCRDHSQMGAQK